MRNESATTWVAPWDDVKRTHKRRATASLFPQAPSALSLRIALIEERESKTVCSRTVIAYEWSVSSHCKAEKSPSLSFTVLAPLFVGECRPVCLPWSVPLVSSSMAHPSMDSLQPPLAPYLTFDADKLNAFMKARDEAKQAGVVFPELVVVADQRIEFEEEIKAQRERELARLEKTTVGEEEAEEEEPRPTQLLQSPRPITPYPEFKRPAAPPPPVPLPRDELLLDSYSTTEESLRQGPGGTTSGTVKSAEPRSRPSHPTSKDRATHTQQYEEFAHLSYLPAESYLREGPVGVASGTRVVPSRPTNRDSAPAHSILDSPTSDRTHHRQVKIGRSHSPNFSGADPQSTAPNILTFQLASLERTANCGLLLLLALVFCVLFFCLLLGILISQNSRSQFQVS
jgi:hypothetical protein